MNEIDAGFGELVGFKNNRPITRKPILLNGGSLKGKVIVLQNKNVKIPIKLCTMVPENERKAVLEQFPRVDKKQTEVKSYHDKKQTVDKHNGTLQSDDGELVDVKMETDIQPNGDSSNINRYSNIQKCEMLNSNTPNCGMQNNNSETSNCEIHTTKNSEIQNKSKFNNTIEPNKKQKIFKINQMERRKKQKVTSSQSKTLQNIVKYIKSQKVNKIKNRTNVRSISCQTEAFTSDISCQTEKVDCEDWVSGILNMFDNNDKDLLASPARPNIIDSGISFQLGPIQNNFNNMVLPNVDPRKIRFYESLKNCCVADPAGHIPLHLAALHNDSTEVHNQCLLLKARNLCVDIPNNQGSTPLHLAVLNECDAAIITMLLTNGADPLTKDNEGNSSLHTAVLCKANEEIVILLLNHLKKMNGDVDSFNYEGFTPLMLCVIENNYELACKFIEAGADPNTKDQKSGRTSLFHAVENNNLHMVHLFMKTGANTKIKNFFGTSTHEATFELENINPEIKSLIIGKDMANPKPKVQTVMKKKKKSEKPEAKTYKNKLKTVRILRIIQK